MKIDMKSAMGGVHILLIVFVISIGMYFGGYENVASESINKFFLVNQTSDTLNRTSEYIEVSTPEAPSGILATTYTAVANTLMLMWKFFLFIITLPFGIFLDPILPIPLRLLMGGTIILMYSLAIFCFATGREF